MDTGIKGHASFDGTIFAEISKTLSQLGGLDDGDRCRLKKSDFRNLFCNAKK
jgi:hypothetical protein